MPVFDNMDSHSIGGSNYGFSAKRIDELGATEYTLVVIACDGSSSVSSFRDEMETCVKETVNACRQSPRSDNLMMRMTLFNSRLREVHGFRPLSECDVDKYTNSVQVGGTTALYDAACNAADAVTQYGADLVKNDFDVNGIVIVITDGGDNASAMTATEVRKSLERAVQSEALESLVSILVGVNVQDPTLGQMLNDFSRDAGFTQYVELGNANASTLMKLVRKYAGLVVPEEYLVYETTDYKGVPHAEDPERPGGHVVEVKRIMCRRVVSTGHTQGSGPVPGQNWIALEGDERIRRYGDSHEDDVVLVLARTGGDPGIPEGRLTEVWGTG